MPPRQTPSGPAGVRAPISIQLAVQGGGAKISALCAAMDALQKFEADGILRVTRIAGTSAGSIVGCLFAAGVPFSELRIRAQSLEKRWIKQTFPRRWKSTIAWRLFRHTPLWSEAAIRDVLSTLFEKVETSNPVGPVTDLESLQRVRNIPIEIVASDLIEGRAHVFSSTSTPNANLVSAILDSCAVPFYLRTGPGQGRPLVDGGICENFPALSLGGDPNIDGPIVGIGFAQRPRTAPGSSLELAAALLDTAMNSSMARARAKVGREFMHDVVTKIDTFDFAAALEHGFGTEYDDAYRAATKFFGDLAQRLASKQGENLIQADPWIDGDRTALQSVSSLYRAHYQATRFEYLESVLEVTANSLCEDSHHCYGLADTLNYRLVFAPDAEDVYAHSIAVAPSVPMFKSSRPVPYLNQRYWRLTDASGKDVRTISMPALDGLDSNNRRMVLFFDPPLKVQSTLSFPFTLVFRDWTDRVMAKLDADGMDELGISFTNASAPVKKAALILHVPESSGARFEPSRRDEAFDGRPMNAAELAACNSPQGFRTIGWIGADIPQDKWLVANVLR